MKTIGKIVLSSSEIDRLADRHTYIQTDIQNDKKILLYHIDIHYPVDVADDSDVPDELDDTDAADLK